MDLKRLQSYMYGNRKFSTAVPDGPLYILNPNSIHNNAILEATYSEDTSGIIAAPLFIINTLME